MKYIVVENKEEQPNELLYDIADFFWNNGNEVHISCNYSTADFEEIIQICDCIVLLNYQEDCFNAAREAFHIDATLEKSISRKNFLVFSEKGVYTDAIPFPHKIYHFDKFSKIELTRFFHWCNKFHLFQQHESINCKVSNRLSLSCYSQFSVLASSDVAPPISRPCIKHQHIAHLP